MSRPARLIASKRRNILSIVLAALLLVGVWHNLSQPAYGAQLGDRRLQLSTSEVSATASYLLSFQLSTAGSLGSVTVQFCSNDPFPEDPCDAPPGMDVSGAALSAQAGPGGFTIGPATTANELVLTRPVSNASIGPVSFTFTNIVNASAPGSYYVRLQTFATSDASGPASDYGGIAFALASLVTINAEVPPYLLFCTGVTIPGLNCANAQGDFIDFGELSSSHSSSGSSQMLIGTNSGSGYNVTVGGTTMASGNNIIAALGSNDVSRPGTAQFGFNLRANNTPAVGDNPQGPGVAQPEPDYDQPDSYRFDNGDVIVSNAVPDNIRLFTASYLVNVPATQAPGIYVTTLTYVCLANF